MSPEYVVDEKPRSGRLGGILRAVALAFAAIALILACVGYWMKSTILDTGEFISKFNDVLARPETSQRIGDVVAERVVSSGVVQQRIDESLPANAAFVGTLLEGQLQDVLSTLFSRAVSLNATQNLISLAVEHLHDLVVATLENRRSRVEVQDNAIVLDLNDTVTNVFNRLGIERPVNQDLGKVVLIEDAKSLGTASRLVRTLNTSVPILFAAALVLFGIVILTSPDRGQAVSRVGYTVIIAGVVSLIAWRATIWGTSAFLNEAPIGRAMVHSLASNLKTDALVLIGVGAVTVACADRRIRGWFTRRAAEGADAIEALGASRTILLGAAAVIVVLLVV